MQKKTFHCNPWGQGYKSPPWDKDPETKAGVVYFTLRSTPKLEENQTTPSDTLIYVAFWTNQKPRSHLDPDQIFKLYLSYRYSIKVQYDLTILFLLCGNFVDLYNK